ncbi:MAG: SusC/RagA family TonB-linked outer membrane protein [Gemmatimonadales bacterium]
MGAAQTPANVPPADTASAEATSVPSALLADSVITGVVVNAQGAPLPGLRLEVVGTTLQVNTDADGAFRLGGLSSRKVTLRISGIGYRPRTQTVDVGSRNLRLVMTEAPFNLDELVVTGVPGATEKRALGNAVGQLNPTDLTDVVPVADVTDMLNGRIPGVALNRGGGLAGTSGTVTIRGRSSMSLPPTPLIYIDGVRVSSDFGFRGSGQSYADFNALDLVDPEDIEKIEVIKGPSAATLYGTEASAGVIQIITKKGAGGGKAKIDLSIRQGTNWFMDAEGRIPINYWKNPATGEIVTENLVALEDARGTPIFRSGHTQDYNLNLSGGTEQLGYYTSLNYDRDEGVTKDNHSGRTSARARVTFKPTSTVQVDASTGFSLIDTRLPLLGGLATSVSNIYYGSPSTLDTPLRGFWQMPAEIQRSIYSNNYNQRRTIGGLEVKHRPASWFEQRLAIGLDLGSNEQDTYSPRLAPELVQFVGTSGVTGSRVLREEAVQNLTFDYSGTATWRPSSTLEAKTSLGAQHYRKATDYQTATAQNFPAPGLKAISAASVRQVTQDRIENNTLGVFAQQQLGYKGRLYLTGALRVDDNSAFGKNFDFVTYPKMSASWVINEEPFWKVGFVNSLKLRAAYGASGQQPTANAAVRTYGPIIGEGDQPGLVPQAVGNPDLKPERGEEIEAGLDANLFHDRIGLEFTYYRKRTKDAILLVNVPPSSGFYPNQQYTNAGTIKNNGAEMLVSAQVVNGRSVGLNLSASVSTNHNEILKLADGIPFINSGWIPNRNQPGYPVSSYFFKRVVSAELDADHKPINVLCDGGPGNAPVACNVAPRVFIGQPEPTWEGSVSSTLSLGRSLQLYANVDFKLGWSTYDWATYSRCVGRPLCDISVSPEKYDAITLAEQDLARTFEGGYYVTKMGFAKLREVALSYTLPNQWARALGATNAVVSIAGRNLHTWTNYHNLPDPEVSFKPPGQSSDRDSPWTLGVNPLPTQFITTVHLTF